MHGEDFQPAVQGVTCPGSVNNSNCAYNFPCVALKIHPTDFSSMSSNSAAIYYILRVETRTLKLQDGSGRLCCPPFSHPFPGLSQAKGSCEELRRRRRASPGLQGVPSGGGSLCLARCLQESRWSVLGSADVCLQTDLSGPWFHVWGPCRSLEGTVHVWGAGLVPQGPEQGRTSSSHRVETNRLP